MGRELELEEPSHWVRLLLVPLQPPFRLKAEPDQPCQSRNVAWSLLSWLDYLPPAVVAAVAAAAAAAAVAATAPAHEGTLTILAAPTMPTRDVVDGSEDSVAGWTSLDERSSGRRN